MTVREQAKWWGAAFAGLIVVLWILGDVLLPFIVGGAIAYFLDPVADRLERAGCSRAVATTIIALVGVFAAIVAILMLIPTLIQQASSLINSAPAIFEGLRSFLADRVPLDMVGDPVVQQAVQGIGRTIQERGLELVNTVFSSALTVVDAVVFLLVVPVVAFYMLLDWDRMIAVIDGWLPREHAPVIRQLAREVDGVLAGFVRGQLSVCGMLGVFYAALLVLVGLQYGIIVGFVAGLISFIPYVGATVGGAIALGLAFFQFWNEPWWIGAVLAVFVAGQMLEGNYLTPKFVGGSVGLHPVWLLFALSAFGSFFGFVGMLVAVPLAAMIGVFTRFGVGRYLGGRLYGGPDG